MHAIDVDAEHSLEILRSQVQERFDLGDAGVGNPIDKSLVSRPRRRSLRLSEWQHLHRVQGPEFFDALLDHCFDITHYRDISQGYSRPSAEVGDLVRDFFRASFVAFNVVDANVIAVPGKAKGDGFAAIIQTFRSCSLSIGRVGTSAYMPRPEPVTIAVRVPSMRSCADTAYRRT